METELSSASIHALLHSSVGAEIDPILPGALYAPVNDLLARPSKNLRAELVRFGLRLSDGASSEVPNSWLRLCEDVLEMLHAGSLVIDDIEDGSLMRRGKPSLHETYGVPIALNAGNWLYFWPLERVREANLPPEIEMGIYRAYHRALAKAHLGQAVDLGIAVDQIERSHLWRTCLGSLELKSGALTALALVLGATIAGASPERVQALEAFGVSFGIGLQMFDDLGNFKGLKEPEKRWEDLKLRRPSWIWACLGEMEPASLHASFRHAVQQLPQEAALVDWIATHPHFTRYCWERASEFVKTAHATLEKAVGISPAAALRELQELEERLSKAYG